MIERMTIATGETLALFKARKAADEAYHRAITPHEQATAHAAIREIGEQFSVSLDRAYVSWRDGTDHCGHDSCAQRRSCIYA